MGKDRRKKDTGKRQTTPTPSEVDSEPKGQRAPRVRAHQRENTTNTAAPVIEKAPGTPLPQQEKKEEPVNTAELFANLKRETDDIKALTTKKYAKRQIFSNWERYEEPPPEPQQEVEIQGADFESLVKAPDLGAGHFQFKSEKAWNANVTALSGELFSLDIDLLADGLATIPYYRKLDIPITLYSEDEILDMDAVAHSASKQYEATKKNAQKPRDKKEDAKATTDRLLGLLMDKELSPAPIEKNASEEKNDLNFDIDQPEIQEPDVNANMINSDHNSVIPEADKMADHRQTPSLKVTETQSENIKEEIPNSIQETRHSVTPVEIQEVLPRREVERKTDKEIEPPKDMRKVTKEVSPPKDVKKITKEVVPPPTDTKDEVPEQPPVESSDNILQEPAIPLGQRAGRRKGKSSIQVSESQNKVTEFPSKSETSENKNKVTVTENQKNSQVPKKQNKAQNPEKQSNLSFSEKQKEHTSEKQNKVQVSENQNKSQPSEKQAKLQQNKLQSQPKQTKPQEPEDDLDFLLSLKKPVKEAPISASHTSQVAKPSIEEDDAEPDPQLTLTTPQKTEDLEDWLDSMLDD